MIQLTEKQKEIIDSPARVKLVIGGYRSGKTVLAIMSLWEEMKRRQNPDFKANFLVPTGKILKCTEREIKNILPITSVQQIDIETKVLFTDKYGLIILSTKFPEYLSEYITIDNATSSKYVVPGIIGHASTIYMTGHIPENWDNMFFKLWLRTYFSDNSDIKAFRLGVAPGMEQYVSKERANQLKLRIGESRFNRDYLCIPDYLECDAEERRLQMFRREYLAEFTSKVENNEISFNFKGPYFMGFDKAKE